ncbi:TRAP transporter small permease [Salisediminibacterium selenitireducens]|uniref:Tripartite ATP-independent periplasmic transporter DctQ component n=1 Tax=Bacillus selenitireducens (strain ATCC 700615 / DSM 15326 / MLS10) TaxID=439292 RepID=D6XZP7_BACIE|nr:TRAP transporter small permease [Salisediminibacterium selenitireducens]ADH98421.1 Tripartite ATP-independent periplasmic transporter DctQ component [[Bacillus] selenitireducens MLS10]
MTDQPDTGWFNRIINGFEALSSILLALLTIVVFGEVLSRYVFQLPLVFSNELTLILFPWMIFLGAVAVTKDDGHLAVSYFRDRLPYAYQKGLYLFSKVIMLSFSVAMAYASWRLADNVSNQLMPVLRISRSWLSISITVSFIAISLVLIRQIYWIMTDRMKVPTEEDLADDLDHDS